MARYSLIVRDKTYMAILQRAASEGKSFGKKVNEILDNFVSFNDSIKRDPTELNMCEICGKEPYYEVFLHNERKSYRCRYHKPESYYMGYREVSESKPF